MPDEKAARELVSGEDRDAKTREDSETPLRGPKSGGTRRSAKNSGRAPRAKACLLGKPLRMSRRMPGDRGKAAADPYASTPNATLTSTPMTKEIPATPRLITAISRNRRLKSRSLATEI